MAGRKERYASYVKPHLQKIPLWMQTMTEEQIAKRLGVSTSTWHEYKNKYPELADAVKQGRQDLITDIKSALIMRAKGFEYEEKKQYTQESESGLKVYTEITTKRALPDVGACNSILQNLDKDWYRDKAAHMLRRQELALRERIANANTWLDDNNEEDAN